MWISINYNLLSKWKPIVVTTLIVEVIYQAIIYLHPKNLDWVGSNQFSWLNALKFIFIDQVLIECITVGIIFQLIRVYSVKFNLVNLKLSAGSIISYELKFLPILLLAFFAFAPFTLTVRFLFHYLPDLSSDIYFNEYFYSTTLYFNYLTPVLLVGYSIINVNLIYQYNQQLNSTKQDLHKAKRNQVKARLSASDEFGELLLETDNIEWVKREDRKTFAQIGTKKYRLKGSVSDVEKKLDPNTFVRINRSTIVNLNYVQNYSFWENDKYIVRIKDIDKEFVMSRERLQKIKDKFLT